MLPWIFLILQLLFALLFFYMALAFLTGAPYVPSTTSVSKVMIALAHIKKGETIVDLGSGDGRLLFLAARAGAKAIGLEINPYLVLFTTIKALCSPERTMIRAYWKNFWRADFQNANVVFVYLLPWRMKQLEEKLLREMKPGSRVVSNSFIFPNIPCTKKDELHHVYLFTIPIKKI
ncbi:MAG: hypothetical protein WAV51_01690 [Microgenomates group bacterium]